MSYYGNDPYKFDGETPNKNPRTVWPPHGHDQQFGGYGDRPEGGSKVPSKPKKPLPSGGMSAARAYASA